MTREISSLHASTVEHKHYTRNDNEIISPCHIFDIRKDISPHQPTTVATESHKIPQAEPMSRCDINEFEHRLTTAANTTKASSTDSCQPPPKKCARVDHHGTAHRYRTTLKGPFSPEDGLHVELEVNALFPYDSANHKMSSQIIAIHIVNATFPTTHAAWRSGYVSHALMFRPNERIISMLWSKHNNMGSCYMMNHYDVYRHCWMPYTDMGYVIAVKHYVDRSIKIAQRWYRIHHGFPRTIVLSVGDKARHQHYQNLFNNDTLFHQVMETWSLRYHCNGARQMFNSFDDVIRAARPEIAVSRTYIDHMHKLQQRKRKSNTQSRKAFSDIEITTATTTT